MKVKSFATRAFLKVATMLGESLNTPTRQLLTMATSEEVPYGFHGDPKMAASIKHVLEECKPDTIIVTGLIHSAEKLRWLADHSPTSKVIGIESHPVDYLRALDECKSRLVKDETAPHVLGSVSLLHDLTDIWVNKYCEASKDDPHLTFFYLDSHVTKFDDDGTLLKYSPLQNELTAISILPRYIVVADDFIMSGYTGMYTLKDMAPFIGTDRCYVAKYPASETPERRTFVLFVKNVPAFTCPPDMKPFYLAPEYRSDIQ